MLAELAAANAAFAVIKTAISNGKELASCGQHIANFVIAKEELQRKGSKKKSKGAGGSDLEEFLALEKIKEQEDQLKTIMIYAGRPGLWNDWQKFQAEARKSRRVQEELAARKREEMKEYILAAVLILIMIGCVAIFGLWVLKTKGVL